MNTNKNPYPFYQLEGDIWTNYKPHWHKNNANCKRNCCYSHTVYTGVYWFQHQLEASISDASDITSVDLRTVSDNAVVSGTTIQQTIVVDQDGNKYLLIQLTVDSALIGDIYYLSTTTVNVKYYSEPFCVANQNRDRIAMVWAAKCKVGKLVYFNDFKFQVNLDAKIVPAEPEIIIEETEDGFGNETPTFQKLVQPYTFSCVVPNFLAQALSALQLHEFFNVFNFYNGEAQTTDFDPEITKVETLVTPEADGCNSFVTITYTQETVIKTGCCEEITEFGGNTPEIVLASVETNGFYAVYAFTTSGFAPSYLIFQTSQDQVNWSNYTLGVTSPQDIPFTAQGTWYFRITHPSATSNIVTLVIEEDVVAVNDMASCFVNDSVIVNVLDNDTTLGSGIVTSVTDGSFGIATIINGGTQILYENLNAALGDNFEYTLSNGSSQDTAQVSITLRQGTAFQLAALGYPNVIEACGTNANTTRYYKASNYVSTVPVVGDFVYYDQNLTNIFNGHGDWWAITNNLTIRIDDNGEVLEVQSC